MRGALPLTLFITFLLVPSTSSRIFKTFLCDPFRDNDEQDSDGQYLHPPRRYLHEDKALDCDTGEHSVARAWAYVFIVLWPVGVPVLYFALLIARRADLRAKQVSKLAAATRFHWAGYERGFFWYEPVEMLRKLTLSGFLLLINAFMLRW